MLAEPKAEVWRFERVYFSIPDISIIQAVYHRTLPENMFHLSFNLSSEPTMKETLSINLKSFALIFNILPVKMWQEFYLIDLLKGELDKFALTWRLMCNMLKAEWRNHFNPKYWILL